MISKTTCIIILCVFGIVLGLGCVSSDQPASTDGLNQTQKINPEIKITYNSSNVNLTENITGIAKNISNESEVWIVLHPHTANKYYPIDKVDIQNETWSLPVSIGSENDSGTEFDIIAFLADKKAQEDFNNYFKICEETNSWPGMDKIPESAKEYDSITVTRNPPPKITIDYKPQTAHNEEVMNGSAKYVPAGKRIWIVVYPHTAYKYYPIGEAYIQNETWKLPYPVRLGDPENVGIKFDVLAVLADQNAQRELQAYLENQTDQGPWMWVLPNGTEEYSRITVTRI